MTEREIYDRTVAFVSEQMHREFGPIHAMPTGQASALVGFAETLIDAAIERYRVTRRRRPWCRVPWQKQTGRRKSVRTWREPKWLIAKRRADANRSRRVRALHQTPNQRASQ